MVPSRLSISPSRTMIPVNLNTLRIFPVENERRFSVGIPMSQSSMVYSPATDVQSAKFLLLKLKRAPLLQVFMEWCSERRFVEASLGQGKNHFLLVLAVAAIAFAIATPFAPLSLQARIHNWAVAAMCTFLALFVAIFRKRSAMWAEVFMCVGAVAVVSCLAIQSHWGVVGVTVATGTSQCMFVVIAASGLRMVVSPALCFLVWIIVTIIGIIRSPDTWQVEFIRAMNCIVGIIVGFCFGSNSERICRNSFVSSEVNELTCLHAQAQSDRMHKILCAALPESVLERLIKSEGIRDFSSCASIICTDIRGFTEWASTCEVMTVTRILNEMFTMFHVNAFPMEVHCFKTVGDAFWGVCGLHSQVDKHARKTCLVGMYLIDAMTEINQAHGIDLHIRVGVHSGPVGAAVIGLKRFSYDVLGSTAVVANKLESTGVADFVHISQATKALVKDDFAFTLHSSMQFESETFNTFIIRTINTSPIPLYSDSYGNSSRASHTSFRGKPISSELLQWEGLSAFLDSKNISLNQDNGSLEVPSVHTKPWEALWDAMLLNHGGKNRESYYAYRRSKSLVEFRYGAVAVSVFLMLSAAAPLMITPMAPVWIHVVRWVLAALYILITVYIFVKSYDLKGSISLVIDVLTVAFSTCSVVLYLAAPVSQLNGAMLAAVIAQSATSTICIPSFNSTIRVLISVGQIGAPLALGIAFHHFDAFPIEVALVAAACIIILLVRSVQLHSAFVIDITSEKNARKASNRKRANASLLSALYPRYLTKVIKQSLSSDDPLSCFHRITKLETDTVVMFCYFSGVATINLSAHPGRVAELLNAIITRLDQVLDEFPRIEKVKHIGHVYMTVGLTDQATASQIASDQIQFAFRAKQVMADVYNKMKVYLNDSEEFDVKVGIALGDVVSCVLGAANYTWDIFGDTVNVASRLATQDSLESNIVLSEEVFNNIRHSAAPTLLFNGPFDISAKGKGVLRAYTVSRCEASPIPQWCLPKVENDGVRMQGLFGMWNKDTTLAVPNCVGPVLSV